jgi:hypothetical protein
MEMIIYLNFHRKSVGFTKKIGKFLDSLTKAVFTVAFDILDNATYELKRVSGKSYFVFDSKKYKIRKEISLGKSSNSGIGKFSYTRSGSQLKEILGLETKFGDMFELFFKEDVATSKLDFKKINYSGMLGNFTYSR